MKLKILVTICLTFFTAWSVLFAWPVKADTPIDLIHWEYPQLFSDADIKPCDSVTRYVRVDNIKTMDLAALIRAVNFGTVAADNLAHALTIEIKTGATTLYGPKTLAEFFANGFTNLSIVPAGQTVQYDITISFACDKGNEWQTRTTGFDLEVNVSEGDTTVAASTTGNGGNSGSSGGGGSNGGGGSGSGVGLIGGAVIPYYNNNPAGPGDNQAVLGDVQNNQTGVSEEIKGVTGIIQEVLGEKITAAELTPTGFSQREFIGLLALLSVLIAAIVVLRKYQVQ